jgi:hypothetical protein
MRRVDRESFDHIEGSFLVAQNISDISVRCLMGVVLGWLTTHTAFMVVSGDEMLGDHHVVMRLDQSYYHQEASVIFSTDGVATRPVRKPKCRLEISHVTRRHQSCSRLVGQLGVKFVASMGIYCFQHFRRCWRSLRTSLWPLIMKLNIMTRSGTSASRCNKFHAL